MDILEQIKAILFIADRKINIEELCAFFNMESSEMKENISKLSQNLENTSINLSFKNNELKLVTNPNYGKCINDFFSPELKIKKLSKSSMETLAIIAFKGPITKSEIEKIKGISVDASIQVLLEKKLIFSNSRKKSIGNPKLYEVSDNFYGYIGLESKEDLMKIDKADWLNSLNNLEEKEDED